jgi:hypothetical protein
MRLVLLLVLDATIFQVPAHRNVDVIFRNGKT